MDLTLGAALLAGLVSFLSPCVLPVVPAYLGQLGIIATTEPAMTTSATFATAGATAGVLAGSSSPTPAAASTPRTPRTGWRAMPNAFAFVFGFGLIFTLLGIAVYTASGPFRENLPLLRVIGGVILVILGLNLMGVLRLRTLARSWKPLERFGGERPGAKRGGLLGGFTLGAVFAVGWTPCIGPTLGAILTLAAVGASPQVAGLLIAYSIGLGLPFLAMALLFDRAALVTRPILRYSRVIEVVGGGLVVFLGLALIFDWLGLIAQRFSFLDSLLV